ncbi:MAG: endo-1,4-beta-xylanase [Clostridia bacterium]|nr:endo-1,4-beta-xylanase [Clostridia bacterium]
MKKLLALLAVMMLCVCCALADTAQTIDFENGSNGAFGQSGSCSVGVNTATVHGGTYALSVTNRTVNNWDAADMNIATAGVPVGSPVKLTAWVYVDSEEAGSFAIGKAGGDYAYLGQASMEGKTWTEITAEFTLSENVNIRFLTASDNWIGKDYYIDDITIEVAEAAAAETEMTATTFNFEDGMPAQFTLSGSATPDVTTAIAHEGTSSLLVDDRSGNNWDAVDLKADAMGIELGAPVKISVWVYVDSEEEGTFVVSKSGGDYATLGSVTMPGKTWTQLTAEFSLDQPVNIRFQNQSENWNNALYYLDDMVVEVGAAPVYEDTGAEPIDYVSDFSEGEDGWYARSGGGASISVTDEGALFITGRTATWNSPGRDFELVPGKTYNLSVLVKQDQLDSTGFILSIAHTRDDTESYENLGTCTAKKGEWTLIQASYVAGRYDKYVLYVEGGAADTEFAIKEFKCWEQINTFGADGIPSLKEVYADKFDFGTAVTANEVLDADRMEFYASQFNIMTMGNEMKPDALLDMAETRKAVRATKDQTTVMVKFDSCIPFLDWAKENGVKVHGHVLVWHSQTPTAFFHEDYATHKPLVSREVMLARMESYIQQVLTWTNENYPGVIVSWDVVNEAANDGGRKLRESLWYQVVGDDFINRAFEYARKYAAEGTLLFYNDYNTDATVKGLMIGDIIDSLIADGTIDGYGFQSHYSTSTSLDKIKTAWLNISQRKLKDGTPLLLRVSELDVGIPANDDANWRAQAEYYGELFKIYEQYADQIIAVHTWGTVDDLSWRASNYPLLFDSKTQPKYAFWQITDPSQIPAAE